jgi:hypothetical protein
MSYKGGVERVGYIHAAFYFTFILATIMALYAIAPQHLQDEVKEFIDSI